LPQWPSVRKTLLIRLRSIGDTVLMTPALGALKAWRPDIEVTVLSEPLSAPLIESHPLVDKLIVVERSLPSRARLISELRRKRFDVAFNMHGGTTATLIARLSGARHSVGYAAYGLSRLLSARAPAPDLVLGRAGIHSVEQQLALLHWAGVPWPDPVPRLALQIPPEAETSIRRRLNEAGLDKEYAVLAPAAAFESKRWRAEGFAAAARYLGERWNLRCAVIAGPAQEDLAREVAARAGAAARAVVGLDLKEVAALTSLSRLFVGNDSGPMHMAAAVRRPVVALFGSSDPRVWHPWADSPYRIVGRQAGAAACDIKNIPDEDVIAAIDEVMKEALGAVSAADTVINL
jgi:ADP-heptose:LPS heptosyltransferase